jgi:hypothetical protein
LWFSREGDGELRTVAAADRAFDEMYSWIASMTRGSYVPLLCLTTRV